MVVSSGLRRGLGLVIGGLLAGCSTILGISDVPGPLEGGSDGAGGIDGSLGEADGTVTPGADAGDAGSTTPEAGTRTGEATVESAAPGDAGDATLGDATPGEATLVDASGRDTAGDVGSDGASTSDVRAPDGGCPSGFLLCDGGCEPSGIQACGACGNDCTRLAHVAASGLACNAGKCSYTCAPDYADCADSGVGCATDLSTAASCGACGVACPAGSPLCGPVTDSGAYACGTGCPASAPTRCGQSCVDTSQSLTDCGGCGSPCTTSVAHAKPSCASGACTFTCDAGYTACGAACVDEQSDGNNCGGCGAAYACGGGTTCQSGHCVCPAGTLDCAGTCASPSAQNSCGTSCVQACPQPQANGSASCNGTACAITCSSGYTLCSGQCVDEQSDGANCNACGHSCQTGACLAGVCQPVALATGRVSPTSIAVSAAGVFWIEGNGVYKVGLAGGAVTPLASGAAVVDQSYPGCLAADAANVYWTNYVTSAAAVMMVPASGSGSPSVLAPPTSSTLSSLQGVALVGGILYYADNGYASVGQVVVATGVNTQLGRGVNFNPPWYVAADASYVYFSGILQGGIHKVSVGASTPVLVSASTTNLQKEIVVDSTNVYWLDCGACALLRAPITGGASVAVDPGPVGNSIAIDSSGLYWINSSGNLTKAPVVGGVPGAAVTVASGGGPMALDSSAVYWATASAIMKVAK